MKYKSDLPIVSSLKAMERDSLKPGDECESKKNLESEDDVTVKELAANTAGAKSIHESGRDVDRVDDDLEVLGLQMSP